MILVSVQNPGDVQLTRALLQALGKRFEWFILFAGLERMQVKTFHDAHDLPEKVARLLADPGRHLIHTGVEPFIPEQLASRFAQALSVATPPQDYLPVTLKYLDYMRAQRPVAQPGDVDRAAAHIAQDVARIAGDVTQNVTRAEANLAQALDGFAGEIRQQMAQVAANLTQGMANVTLGMQHASRKLGELQRSTLAYKLRRALKGLPKP